MMIRRAFFTLAWLFGSIIMVWAGTATLTWKANTEIDLGGYKVYTLDGPCPTTAALPSPARADVGNALTFLETVPDGVAERCYANTAYDLTGNESTQSMKVSKTFATAPAIMPPSEPVLSLASATESSLTVVLPLVPDGAGGVAKVDLRYAPGPINWGTAPSAPCTASPCVIPGLLPATAYEIEAVAYRGELNMGTAVFSTITPPLKGTTLVATVARTVSATVQGDPTKEAWAVEAKTDATDPYAIEVWFNGALDHIELTSPRCSWGDPNDGTPCTRLVKPAGTYAFLFVVKQAGVEVARTALMVVVPAPVPPPPPPPVEEIFTSVTNANGVLTFQYDPTICTGRGGTSKSTSAIDPVTGKRTVTLTCMKK